MKLYCLVCQKESETRLNLPCPHCGARGKWVQPVEDFKDGFEREIDPKIQCPDGLLHDFKQVKGGTGGQHCIKCGLTKEYLDNLFEQNPILCSG